MTDILNLEAFQIEYKDNLETTANDAYKIARDFEAGDGSALKAYTYYRKTSDGNAKAYHIAYKYKPKTQEKELKKRNTAIKNRTVEKLRAAFAQCTAHDHTGFMRERMSAELEAAISKVCDAFNARSAVGINIHAPQQTLTF